MYHLDERVVEHHLWELGCALQRVCVCVCSFAQYLVFLPCLWTLETRRLMFVAGGSSKAQAESSQELQRRQERERQVDGFRVDSDSEALPKSAFRPCLASEDSRSLMGGSTVVMCVPFGRLASRWQVVSRRPGRHNWAVMGE